MNHFNRSLSGLGLKKPTLFYGWVIVAACVVLQTMQYGIQYSFGIFFKPMSADFGWSRGATSGAYAILMLSAGASAIPLGWLADKFGPSRIMVVSGCLTGLALILTSRVNDLWQLYMTFGFLEGVAIGGTVAVTSGVTSRWFVKRRGLALGIVSSAIGLGTLVGAPVVERLITAYGWPQTCIIIGATGGAATIVSAMFLRRDPSVMGVQPYGVEARLHDSSVSRQATTKAATSELGTTFAVAVRSQSLWVLTLLFFLVNICVQVVMVHLANYATDLGMDSFSAATVISVIGLGSIVGRLVMGTVADRIGSLNSLIITSVVLSASLIWLVFANQFWMLYVFAVFYSLAYGGEVPQIALVVGQFFGLTSVIALTGVTSTGIRLGGALGSWLGGRIFDVTNSYLIVFIITAVIGVLTLATAVWLKRYKTRL